MTQLSTMKYRQQPLVQNNDVFFSIDIFIISPNNDGNV